MAINEEPKWAVGDVIEWTSKSGGYEKTKRGVIVTLVYKNESLTTALTLVGLEPAKCRVNAGRIAHATRYAIDATPEGANSRCKRQIYAPFVGALHKQGKKLEPNQAADDVSAVTDEAVRESFDDPANPKGITVDTNSFHALDEPIQSDLDIRGTSQNETAAGA